MRLSTWAAPLAATSSPTLSGHFTWVDWSIVAAVMVGTTLVGGWLAGRQRTFKDFFLAGRRLPWYAVSASIASTQLTAVSFLALPALVFNPGGNLTYLQLPLFGQFFARIIVALWVIPRLYRGGYYSPYDYMAERLGPGVRGMTTVMFLLQVVLGQACRLYLTAILLELLLWEHLSAFHQATGIPTIAASIVILGSFATLWTFMGGIRTAVWTDLVLFVILLAGVLVALGSVIWRLPGGLAEMVDVAGAAGKWTFADYSISPTRRYTIWVAIIGGTWGGIESVGGNQAIVQRLLCCRSVRAAQWALVSSWLGIIVPISGLLVGGALYAYYARFPLVGEALAAYQRKPDSVFGVFMLTVLPSGVTGIIVAGLFAAAIDSVLPALAQTSMSAFYLPWRNRATASAGPEAEAVEERRNVTVARAIVVAWGAVIVMMALMAEKIAARYASILDLIQAMGTYGSGAVLGGLILALVPWRIGGRGFLFAAPLSVFWVLATAWHEPWSIAACWVGGGILMTIWLTCLAIDHGPRWPGDAYVKTAFLLAGVGLMLLTAHHGYAVNPANAARPFVLAFTWYTTLGSIVTIAWTWLLRDAVPAVAHADIDRSDDRPTPRGYATVSHAD